MHFTIPDCRCKVTFNDPLDSFFIITVHVPRDVPSYSQTVSRICMEVRDTLMSAVIEVTQKLKYCTGTLNVVFLCEEHKSTSLHPATFSKFGDELLCTKFSNTKGGSLTIGHKVWLRGICLVLHC